MDFTVRTPSATKSILNVCFLQLSGFVFMPVAFKVFLAFIPVALQTFLTKLPVAY